ncbi:uncharacterized protein LOC144947711 isoform X3 [Lampetra fluviatilis]
MPEPSSDYHVVVFGAGGVGKSSLVLRFVRGTFREAYVPTVEDTYRQLRQERVHAADHRHHGLAPVPRHAAAGDLAWPRLPARLRGDEPPESRGAAAHLRGHRADQRRRVGRPHDARGQQVRRDGARGGSRRGRDAGQGVALRLHGDVGQDGLQRLRGLPRAAHAREAAAHEPAGGRKERHQGL